MLRNRGTKDPIKIISQLDAFPKVPEKYKSSSQIGGTLSVISRALIVYLIYIEIKYYMDSELIFKFKPDTDMDSKLKIHIDITVATRCRSLGADILDSTNQNVYSFGTLEEEDTWFELCPNQRAYFEYEQHINSYLRTQFHSLANLVYKEVLHNFDKSDGYNLPKRSFQPKRPYDACRIHGSLTLNKVSGNFHITGGKSFQFPQGHVHISALFDDSNHNFTHRINRLSFGDKTTGFVQPLEGDEKIFDSSAMMIQYFVDVVPTEIESILSNIKTFQYSVKENIRPIDHHSGSHGVPGIYLKYDMSALKVLILRDKEHFLQLFVRLCSIIAGIVVISGILNSIIQSTYNCVLRTFAPQAYLQLDSNRKLVLTESIVSSNGQQVIDSSPNNSSTANISNNILFYSDLSDIKYELKTVEQ